VSTQSINWQSPLFHLLVPSVSTVISVNCWTGSDCTIRQTNFSFWPCLRQIDRKPSRLCTNARRMHIGNRSPPNLCLPVGCFSFCRVLMDVEFHEEKINIILSKRGYLFLWWLYVHSDASGKQDTEQWYFSVSARNREHFSIHHLNCIQFTSAAARRFTVSNLRFHRHASLAKSYVFSNLFCSFQSKTSSSYWWVTLPIDYYRCFQTHNGRMSTQNTE
jgi:hypothetical protein